MKSENFKPEHEESDAIEPIKLGITRIASLEKVEERSEERIKSLEMVALKTFLRIDRIVRAIDKSKSVRGL